MTKIIIELSSIIPRNIKNSPKAFKMNSKQEYICIVRQIDPIITKKVKNCSTDSLNSISLIVNSESIIIFIEIGKIIIKIVIRLC